jgi:hypothetical protein
VRENLSLIAITLASGCAAAVGLRKPPPQVLACCKHAERQTGGRRENTIGAGTDGRGPSFIAHTLITHLGDELIASELEGQKASR